MQPVDNEYLSKDYSQLQEMGTVIILLLFIIYFFITNYNF